LVGTPTEADMSAIPERGKKLLGKFPKTTGKKFEELFPSASKPGTFSFLLS